MRRSLKVCYWLGVDELKVCERAAHTEWRQTAARVAQLATASLSAKRVSMREVQEAIERYVLK